MSGFGLKALRKKKEEHAHEEKNQFIQNIVYGDDSFAVLTYLKLVEKLGTDSVKLICENYIEKDAIISEWKCSINTIRNEEFSSKLMELKPELEILPTPAATKVSFYKDTKFHFFGGRAKPYELKPGEDFFQYPYYDVKLEGLFTDEQWNNLDETLRVGQLNKYLDHIELSEPTDLVEKTNFILHTGEYESIQCENLYWCDSPKTFYKKVKNKNKINDALGEFCNSLEHRSGLTVHFEVDGKVYDNNGTLFLPQSVTHEWGHFICDFEKFNETTNKQNFTCLMFVNEDEVNEEELAKKIRLMKRVLERILPDLGKTKYNEHIHYNQNMFINDVKDELQDDIEFDHGTLKFIGQGAPIGNAEKYQYLSRAIVSYLFL